MELFYYLLLTYALPYFSGMIIVYIFTIISESYIVYREYYVRKTLSKNSYNEYMNDIFTLVPLVSWLFFWWFYMLIAVGHLVYEIFVSLFGTNLKINTIKWIKSLAKNRHKKTHPEDMI